MRRRRFLGAAAGLAAGFAGCLRAGYTGGTGSGAGSSSAAPESTPASDPVSVGGVELPVPDGKIFTALPRDHIPAIVDPAFASDWSGLDAPEGVDPTLPDDTAVIGVERDGRARAYPLRVLDWHEAVNDELGGPLLVTYCVLCGSGIVAERFADGTETVFGISGKLWRDDLVLYDRATESLWSQILGAAIRGPLTGERLDIVPSSLLSWGEWRDAHPDTEVLLPPPRSNTVRGPDATFDYFEPKYSYGDQDQLIGYDSTDGELRPRTLVVGITSGGEAKAYPFGAVREAGVVNDTVGGLPVVVALTPSNSMAAYVRRVDGRTLTFEAADGVHLRADGSRWERATGRAVDGPHEGTELDPASPSGPMFWEGWSGFHPDTEVYERRE